MERQWLDLPWRKVRDSVMVKLAVEGGEMYVLAKSEGRQAKEMAMRRSCSKRDQPLLRIGRARAAAGRAFGFVEIQSPAAKPEVTRESFSFRVHALLVAFKPGGRRSGCDLGALYPVNAD